MMNNELWNKIETFDFDQPMSEYGFSVRLANENYWTKKFTDQAILEYKKFMYLAVVTDSMVSPSPIVDVVWHQHLIFSKSYQDFCELIGKSIQHIPSTHNRQEAQRFKQAKDRTQKLYEETFGKQPRNIWDCHDMYESLNLKKARYKLRTIVIFGILVVIALTVPFYYALFPIYKTIDSADFLPGFFFLTFFVVLGLRAYNLVQLRKIAKSFAKESFVYQLKPYELVYLKTQRLSNVVNGVVNELIDENKVSIYTNNTLGTNKKKPINSTEQYQVVDLLSEFGDQTYPELHAQLLRKPVFTTISNSMDAFKKYVNKSEKFGKIFYLNLGILLLLILLCFTRLATGVMREKPVFFITILLLSLVVYVVYHLFQLTKQMSTKVIPNMYKNEILPTREIGDNWQWHYFMGTAVFTASFVPLVNYVSRHQTDSSSHSCSSCGSSCGSSCSSCGGCGGD